MQVIPILGILNANALVPEPNRFRARLGRIVYQIRIVLK